MPTPNLTRSSTTLNAALNDHANGFSTVRQWLSPLLIVMSATALAYLASGGAWLQVALIGLDCVLLGVTFSLIKRGIAVTRLGLVWIGVIITLLIGVKLLPVVLPGIGGAAAGTLGWLGFSYFAFRLLHMLFDARAGKTSTASFGETIIYALHPSTLIAGPIDRLPRNLIEQRRESLLTHRLRDGIWRILLGMFKKLALANSFYAVVSAVDMAKNPDQSLILAWIWLCAYAFYLYFDFAGYSDLAIGAARLMGIRLPENFANPYGQPTLTKFWQSWHSTLSVWLRDYVFFPVTRTLLIRTERRFQTVVMLVAQLITMLICGLWHGMSINFALWGLWHGVGLFLTAQTVMLWRQMGWRPLPALCGVPLTFLIVAFGWVFFATPTPDVAMHIFSRLLGR